MDDNAPKENPPAGFNKLDLSQLQGFSFGTQWTQDKSSPAESRDRDERPRRDDRREGGGGPGAGPVQRDRRTFRKPAGAPAADGGAPAGGGAGPRDYANDRGPRRDGGGDSRDGQGYRRDTPSGDRRTSAPFDRGPYDSPYFSVTFYPEDTSFNTLVQTIRKSCRTIELFEIARTVVAKLDRFIVVLARKAPAAPAAAAAPAEPPKQPLYISVPDGLPFETEEAAIAHVLSQHLALFFDTAEAEIEAPKGNFQVINKCSITGELLGPPNYHRYASIVQQHHAAKIPRMSLEAYRNRIETVRDPEVVAQWLEKMKKTTRYTWKNPANVRLAAATAVSASTGETRPPLPTPAASAAPAVETPVTDTAEGTPVAPAPEAPPAITFDSFEDARAYLLSQAREKILRQTESARFHGKVCELLPPGEICRAIEGALERQRRFPLDTANALRGRLRREHFTIFKKGSKGVSYVCAVKRKFRVPGQTFADSIGALIGFIESHPMVKASALPVKFLNIQLPPQPAGETNAPIEHVLSVDDRAKIARLQGDLVWLVREGYVTEFIDGRLFAPPPMVEARKKEVEAEDHDPENFPDAPANETPPPFRVASLETTPPMGLIPPTAMVEPASTSAPEAETEPEPTATPPVTE